MAREAGFHSACIIEPQWEAFAEFVNSKYSPGNVLVSGHSLAEKAFYIKLFADEDGVIGANYCRSNDFWIRMIRDHIGNNLNLGNNEIEVNQLNLKTVDERLAYLKDVMRKAFV